MVPPSASSNRRGGAGERAPLVAEDLALEQRLGEGGAVDGDEGPPGPGTVVVDGAGHHLLAGPALAAEQHGGSALGHPVHHVEHLPPGGAAAHHAAKALAHREEGRRVGSRPRQRILRAVQPHPGREHRGRGGEDAQIAVEGEWARRPAPLGGQDSQGGAHLAKRDRVERARVVANVPPAPGSIQEGRLVGEAGNGDGEPGVEDPSDDPLPGAQTAEDALLVGHLRGRLDEDLARHRVEEGDGAVLHLEVRAKDLEHRGEGLG
jgi:hypothetical protein